MTDWLKPDQREKLKRRLDELPDLMALVETMHLTLMPRRATGGGSKPHPASRPPVNLGLVDLLDTRPKLNGRTVVDADELVAITTAEQWAARQREEGKKPNATTVVPEAKGRRVGILLCLESWVRVAAEEMTEAGEEHTPPREDPTISSESSWLSQHVGWIAGQQWSGDLSREVSAIWKDLRKAASERAQYSPRCPGCMAWLTSQGSFWSCSACGRDYRDERMVMSCQEPMTGERIAHLFDLNYSTIRTWSSRGELEPAVGEDGQPRMDGRKPLFWIIDVLRLADSAGLTAGRMNA